jgi:LPS-assembly lipoprotein
MQGNRFVLSRRTVWLGALAGACSATLSGCGFALRGAPKFAFESVRLQGSATTPVARELLRALENAGLRVLTADTPATPGGGVGQVVMTVVSDQREKMVVGQTAAGQVREMQLRTRFMFRLSTAAGRVLLDDTELLLERDISFTETAVLAKEAEEALLYRDMQSDIVQQVMRRLAAVQAL